MRKFFTASFLLLFASNFFARIQKPVSGTATSKKISDKTYEIHLISIIDKDWRTDSQSKRDGGIVSTSLIFTKNPLLRREGNTKEVDKLVQQNEPLFNLLI